MTDKLLPDISDYTSTLLVQNGVGLQNISYQRRVLWTTKHSPLYAPTRKFSFVSFPVLTWMAQLGIDEVKSFTMACTFNCTTQVTKTSLTD